MNHAIRAALAAAVAAGIAGCTTTDPSAVYFKGAGGDSNVFVAPGHAAVRKVAVMPFKAPTELIGVSVSDQVLTELLRTGRYKLVERGQMAQVLGEQELALAGLSAGKAAQVGAMVGADGVIIGTVSEYESVAQGGRTIPVVGVSARLIAASSGKILWSADLSQRARDGSVTLSEHSRRVVHELIAGVFRQLGRTQ
jgi:curli biogenesis system outer membrane secretion channel CsgG